MWKFKEGKGIVLSLRSFLGEERRGGDVYEVGGRLKGVRVSLSDCGSKVMIFMGKNRGSEKVEKFLGIRITYSFFREDGFELRFKG